MTTRPFPVEYALAREYLELLRARGNRPRTILYREATGGMNALAGVASSMHLVQPGTCRFHSLARETLAAYPVDAGPEWLDRAAADLAARLDDQ